MNKNKILLLCLLASFNQPMHCADPAVKEKKSPTLQERVKLVLKGAGLSALVAGSSYVIACCLLNSHDQVSTDWVQEYISGREGGKVPAPCEVDSYRAYRSCQKANAERWSKAALLLSFALSVAYANLRYQIPQNAYTCLKESCLDKNKRAVNS